MFQRRLHIRYTGDDLQHLRVEGVELFALFERALLLGQVTDDRCHAGHGLAQLVARCLDFLALQFQLFDDGLFLALDLPHLVDTNLPDIEYDDDGRCIDQEHPPRQVPRAVDDHLDDALLIAHGAISVQGFHVEYIFAAAQVVERHAMIDGIAVAPVLVKPFHPVHELQSLALVVVACRELDGKGVLVALQLDAVALVERLCQQYISVVDVAYLYLFLADEQLCQHHAGQRAGVVGNVVTCPVDAIERTEEHVAVGLAHNGTDIEFVAQQAVGHVVVVESETNRAVLVVALNDYSRDAVAGRRPDVVAAVLGNAADIVVAQSLLLGDVVQVVVHQVQYVDTLACTYPYQSS